MMKENVPYCRCMFNKQLDFNPFFLRFILSHLFVFLVVNQRRYQHWVLRFLNIDNAFFKTKLK